MTEMKTSEEMIDDVVNLFETYRPNIKSITPKHLTVDRIIRMAITAVQRNPDLAKCTHGSLVGCLIAATQLGLEVDSIGQKAHMIPYGSTCKLIFGYKGLMELAKRANDVVDILPPQFACQNDEFGYELGSKPWITHKPNVGERGEATHYYVVSLSLSGERLFTVMSRAEVDRVMADATATIKRADGPWFTHFDAMGLKTVIRRHCKYISSSAELQRAITLDEQAEVGAAQAIDFLETTLPQQSNGKPKTLDDFTDKPTEPKRVNDPPTEPTNPAATKSSGSIDGHYGVCGRCGRDDGKHVPNCPNEPKETNVRTSETATKTDKPTEPIDESKPMWVDRGGEPVPPITGDVMSKQDGPDKNDPVWISKLQRCRTLYTKLEKTSAEKIVTDFGLDGSFAIGELVLDDLQCLGDIMHGEFARQAKEAKA